MAITKKKTRNSAIKTQLPNLGQFSEIDFLFITAAYSHLSIFNGSFSEVVDEDIVKRWLFQKGLPNKLLGKKTLFSSGINKWLNNAKTSSNLVGVRQSTAFKNLRNLTKDSNNPKAYLKLALFALCKSQDEQLQEIISDLASSHQENITSILYLLQCIGITNKELSLIIKEVREQKAPAIFSSNGDNYSSERNFTINGFLSNVVINPKFINTIQSVDVENFSELIQSSFQLDTTSHLSKKDFDSDVFNTIHDYLSVAMSNKRRGVNILLHGEPGVGKTALTKVVANALSCRLFDITSSQAENYRSQNIQHQVLSEIAAAHELCSDLDDVILLVDECDDFFHEDPFAGRSIQKQGVNQLLELNKIPTIWVTNRPYELEEAYLRRFDIVQEIKLIPPENQFKKVKALSCGLRLTAPFIQFLSKQKELSIGHLERAIKVTKNLSLTGKLAEQKVTTLLNGYLIAGGYKELNYIKKKSSSYDIKLTNSEGVSLTNIRKGIERLGESRILLYGPPGTGKTAYAKYLSEKLDMPLIIKKASDLLSAYVGQTEEKIAEAFTHAKAENAILLIDEVDSFLTSRAGHSNSWESTMVNEMLVQMESFDGVFIATTNFNQKLDHAVARRFDFKVKLNYLNNGQAISLFNSLVKTVSDESKAELVKLSQLTPGDFAVVRRKAKLLGIKSEPQLLKMLGEEMNYKLPECKPIGFIGA